jgi:cytochrome P450
MWERFPPRMRKVITTALEEAGRAGRDEAAAADLLVAMAKDEECAAVYMLERSGVAPGPLVGELHGHGDRPAAPPNRQWAERLSAEALHLLDVAADEARRHRHDHVGTEHVALALARLDHVPAARALKDKGFTYDGAEAALRAWYAAGLPRRRDDFSRIARRSALTRRVLRPLQTAARCVTGAWGVFVGRSLVHPGFVKNPYPLYRWLRERHPVRRDPLAPVWVVTRYADVLTILRDPRFKKDPFGPQRLPKLVREQLAVPRGESVRSSRESISMLFLDPPEHTRVRGLFAAAFTPRTLEALRPRVQQITDRWLDRVDRGKGARMDLIADLAYPLPVTVIAELLGFPPEDYERIKKWSDNLAAALGLNPTPEQQARSGTAREEIRTYFDAIAARLRRHPGDNLISRLLAISDEAGGESGEGLSPDELFANAVLLLAAGHETTTNLIGNGMLALLRNPDQLRVIRDDPSLTASAVEELLRYDSPVQITSRVAGEDMSLAGQNLRRGDILLGLIGAANRDPAQFSDPDRLDVRRQDNKHLAFGSGPHFCLGAALARMEGETAIRTLVARYPDLRLEKQKLQWHKGLTFRGVKALLLALK